LEEANKIIEEEIGARIDLQYLSGYNDNMNMIMAAQEEFDLCFTSDWSNPYTVGLENESYIPITDLINEKAKYKSGDTVVITIYRLTLVGSGWNRQWVGNYIDLTVTLG